MADVPVPERFLSEHQALAPNLDALLQQARSGLDQGLPVDDVAVLLEGKGVSPGYAGWLARQLSATKGIPAFQVPTASRPSPPPGPLVPPQATPAARSPQITMLEARLRRQFDMNARGWRVHEAFVRASQFILFVGFSTALIVSSMAARAEVPTWVSVLTFVVYFLGALVIAGLTYAIAILIGLLASVSESTLHTSVNTSPFLDDDAKRRLIQP
jgi:hypothetical protein